jgi:hypothetical protein
MCAVLTALLKVARTKLALYILHFKNEILLLHSMPLVHEILLTVHIHTCPFCHFFSFPNYTAYLLIVIVGGVCTPFLQNPSCRIVPQAKNSLPIP